MPVKATKHPLKTDDKRGSSERGDKRDAQASAKREAAERPVAPSVAVQNAAAERPVTVQPAAQPAINSTANPTANPTAAAQAPNPSSLDRGQQVASYQRQLTELGQHVKALDGILAERDREVARLSQQLNEAQAEAERLRTELHTLRETYRRVGRGTLAAANQFDAVKRWLPGALRNALKRGR